MQVLHGAFVRGCSIGRPNALDQALQAAAPACRFSSTSSQDTTRPQQRQQRDLRHARDEDASAASAAATAAGSKQWPVQQADRKHGAAADQLPKPAGPDPSSPLWHATFSGNVPTDWWRTAPGNSSSSSSSNPTTWAEMCSSSSVIQLLFRFAYSARMDPVLWAGIGQALPARGQHRLSPRAALSSQAYRTHLHRHTGLLHAASPRATPAAYAHKQAVQSRLRREAARIQHWAAADRVTGMPPQQQLQQQQGQRGEQQQQGQHQSRRRRFPLQHLVTQEQQQQQQQQRWQCAEQGPPWAQLVLQRERRCRLRSHGSVAAAADAERRSTSSAGDSSEVSTPQQEAGLAGGRLELSQAVAVGIDMPSKPSEPAAAAAAAGTQPRKCAPAQDEHGNLLPLPASCVAGGCSSSSSQVPGAVQQYSSAISSSSRCVAGVGCDHAALAAEASAAAAAAQAMAAPWLVTAADKLQPGGRKRQLWTRRWLWGRRQQQTAAAPAGSDSAAGLSSSSSCQLGLAALEADTALAAAADEADGQGIVGGGVLLCPDCAVQPGALETAVEQQLPHPDGPQQQQQQPPQRGCAVCGKAWSDVTAPAPGVVSGSAASSTLRPFGSLHRLMMSHDEGRTISMPKLCASCITQPGVVAEAIQQQLAYEQGVTQQQHPPADDSCCPVCATQLPSLAAGHSSGSSSSSGVGAQPAGQPQSCTVYSGLGWVGLGWGMAAPILDSPAVSPSHPHCGPMTPPVADCDNPEPCFDSDSDSGYDDDGDSWDSEEEDSDCEYECGAESDAGCGLDLQECEGAVRLPRAAAQQASAHVFRNQRDIIYGFWSKCPWG